MSKEAMSGKSNFKVICTWCGAVIRSDSEKESRRMCLGCYARMLNEHYRASQQSNNSPYASER